VIIYIEMGAIHFFSSDRTEFLRIWVYKRLYSFQSTQSSRENPTVRFAFHKL